MRGQCGVAGERQRLVRQWIGSKPSCLREPDLNVAAVHVRGWL